MLWDNHLLADHLGDAVPQGTAHVLDDHVLLKENAEGEHVKEDAGSNGHRRLLSAFQRGHVLRVTLKVKSFCHFLKHNLLMVSNIQTWYNLVIKDELKVENCRVKHNFLLLQLRLQFVLNLAQVDEQHLGNLLHL